MLSHENYDVLFNAFAVRNVARHNPAVFPTPAGALHDWEIYNRLGVAYAKAAGSEYKAMPNPMAIVDAGLRAGPYGKDLNPRGAQGGSPRRRPWTTRAFSPRSPGDARPQDPLRA